MQNVYLVCMLIGVGIPLITLVLGSIADVFDSIFDGISNIFDSLNFDFSIDIGNMEICLLPFSIHSICAGLLIFGATGTLLDGRLVLWLVNTIAVVLGYQAAILIQSLIKRLRRVESTTYTKEQMQHFDAKVVNTIMADGYGSVSIQTPDGIAASFPAKSEVTGQRISQDTIVSIVRFEKNTAIVKLKEAGDHRLPIDQQHK